MKTLIPTLAAGSLVLFVLTTFVPYPAAREAAYEAAFDSYEIDMGLHYAVWRRLFFWRWTALELSLLCAMALSILGRRLADRLLDWTGVRRIVAVLGIGLVFVVLHEVLYLPVGIGN